MWPTRRQQGDLTKLGHYLLTTKGYIDDKLAITRRMSGKGVDREFSFTADDTSLTAHGADTTRVVLRVNDEFGNIHPFANDPIRLQVEGPAEILEKIVFLVGGIGAIWIRAKDQSGKVRLTAVHPVLGKIEVEFNLTSSQPEIV